MLILSHSVSLTHSWSTEKVVTKWQKWSLYKPSDKKICIVNTILAIPKLFFLIKIKKEANFASFKVQLSFVHHGIQFLDTKDSHAKKC